MVLARILMMTLAFLLLARLELVAAWVEGVGKGRALVSTVRFTFCSHCPFSVSKPKAKCVEVDSRPKSGLASCQR